jgi:hypothetical protein
VLKASNAQHNPKRFGIAPSPIPQQARDETWKQQSAAASMVSRKRRRRMPGLESMFPYSEPFAFA